MVRLSPHKPPARMLSYVATRVYRIDLHCRGQPDCEESCIVVESRPNRSLMPSFLSVRRLQYTNFMVQAKNAVNKAVGRCV